MSSEIDKLIDEAWNSLLARLAKKDTVPARPSLGDDIDLYVPQVMTMLLMESDPSAGSLIYKSACTSANRNGYSIMKRLGMPADYFWKFEYWPKERAFDTLKRVINRVFSAMMNQNKEGTLDLLDVDIEHMRLTVSFKDCAECAGITAERGICYYHAATFAGIISALINKELDGFESKCHARKDDTCTFTIGKRADPEIAARMSEYLAPAKIQTGIDERLGASLQGSQLRTIGNMVNIWYYRLLVTNSIMTNPALAATSTDMGVRYGTRLAPVISDFYKDSQLSVIRKYYNQLHHLDVTTTESGDGVDILLAESAESEAALKKKELLDFICGEFQGLVSKLLSRNLVCKEASFDGGKLKVKLSPAQA
ncbi:MAG: 4-vinyl reductase [Dehalococcoidia bacterium]|nr:4-vinyl reductase [Dehalococcoidia bacterium]